MLFPTLDFLLFLGVVVAALAAAPNLKTPILVVASYMFYARWNWHFCILLAGSSLLTYAGGRILEVTRTPQGRARVVTVAVGMHLLLLSFFKYFDFIVDAANRTMFALGGTWEVPVMEIVLPVGISFFTFHGISYLIDVSRGDVAVCRRPGDILLYLSFFPQLVAGPIVRSSFFLPQIAQTAPARVAFVEPVLLILGGLFKKVVIANYLATDLVDPVFFDPSRYGAADRLLAAYGYAVQIYCDFSAYTDIAIGLATLLGYRFPLNFNQPYRARSLQDFWRRWHISLSSWLRDYLYKPLGGNRGGRWLTMRNLLITMVLGGIWHGAAWKFVAWGALHGLGLIIERTLQPRCGRLFRGRIGRILATLMVFHFVCVSWIIFRADGLDTITAYFAPSSDPQSPQVTPFTLALLALGLGLNFIPSDLRERLVRLTGAWPAWSWAVLTGAGIAAIDAMGPEGVAPFIYFQF